MGNVRVRKIAVVTGSRGEYSIYRSILDAIEQHPKLDYELIVTGMHLLEQFGNSLNDIKEDNRKIGVCVPMLKHGDSLSGMAKNTGEAIIGMVDAILKIKPDIVLVLGDRGEQLAAAIVASHMNIVVAHLHGGEVSGTIDESIRHAITKFAHLHLPATKMSKERIIKLGEKEENVYLVGSAGINGVKKRGKMSRIDVARYFGFDPEEKIILAVQHPVTTEFEQKSNNIKEFIDALIELNQQTVCIYSNSDAGYTKMMQIMRDSIKKAGRENKIKIWKTLKHEVYLSLLKTCDVMIGNSSSGVIEAPSCNAGYVLVGTRQDGREKARSILEVGYSKDEILAAVDKVFNDNDFKKTILSCQKPYDPFNDDNAGRRIAEVLASFKITRQLLQKRITY